MVRLGYVRCSGVTPSSGEVLWRDAGVWQSIAKLWYSMAPRRRGNVVRGRALVERSVAWSSGGIARSRRVGGGSGMARRSQAELRLCVAKGTSLIGLSDFAKRRQCVVA